MQNTPKQPAGYTIFEQLGGQRICIMLGCKVQPLGDDLRISPIKASRKVSRILVSYEQGTDLYRIRAWRKRQTRVEDQIPILDQHGIHVENLKEFIEQITGCYLSL